MIFASYVILVFSFFQTNVEHSYLGRYSALFVFVGNLGRVIGIPLVGVMCDTQYLSVPAFFIIIGLLVKLFIQGKFIKEENKMFESIFESENLYARKFTLSDANDSYEFYGDESTMGLIGKGKVWMSSKDDLKIIELHINYYEKLKGQGFWAVIDKKTNKLIGHIGVKPVEIEGTEHTEVGYIINKAYQGKGFGTEITKAAIEYAKKNLKVSEIVAIARETNIASVAVMKKCNMVFKRIIPYNDIPGVALYGLEL